MIRYFISPCLDVFLIACSFEHSVWWDLVQGALGDGDLMLICITPDEEGKFGFNVKVSFNLLHATHADFDDWLFTSLVELLNSSQGGVDQKMPLSISHIKPDSPVRKGFSCVHNVHVFKVFVQLRWWCVCFCDLFCWKMKFVLLGGMLSSPTWVIAVFVLANARSMWWFPATTTPNVSFTAT